ncbi:MAG: hypothetical protein RTV72_11940 [Candidatus Thorarchaeota archaeon]
MRRFKQKPPTVDTRPESSKALPREFHFQSVTREFLSSEKSKTMNCPGCGTPIDFKLGVEWMGPDAFLCGSCDKLLHMSLIHRALRDLGVE